MNAELLTELSDAFDVWYDENGTKGQRLKELRDGFAAGYLAGKQAERERCAKIADAQAESLDGHDYAAENIAKRIRAQTED